MNLTEQEICAIGNCLWDCFTDEGFDCLTKEHKEEYEDMDLEETQKLFFEIVKKYMEM